ncbi:ribosome biogenesis factor YjgA [Denitratimonas tolerans]|uniref:Dual-action ribosomal maturation protein DarP n=1 Tax=Denitratimonas tolerans TaxID=1338420 RepID=A0AAW9QWA4_9GAMM
MRGRDPETGEFLSPSRSQKRREALDVLALAERLVELPDGQLAAVALPDDLRELVRDSRRITAQIARKRQLQFLAKAMRREEDDILDAIRGALDKGRDQSRRETAELHRLEAWRERLLEDGDEALAELLDQYPAADRQLVRQLVRNARLEREKQRPPRAFRELFRVLKTLMAGEGEIADAPSDDRAHGEDDIDDENIGA